MKEPLPRQLDLETTAPARVSELRFDHGLRSVLPEKGHRHDLSDDFVWVRTNHVEMFNVFAVAGIDNGLMILHTITNREAPLLTSEAVERFLRDNGLERLIVDHRDMMREALDRRVDPYSMIELNKQYPIGEYDSKTYLDACILHKHSITAGTETYHEAALRQEIDLKDVRKLGALFIVKHNPELLLKKLKQHKAGKLGYDLGTLKKIANSYPYNDGRFASFENMVNSYGFDFTKQIVDLEYAFKIEEIFPDRDVRDLIEYGNQAGSLVTSIEPSELKRLHDEGLDAMLSCQRIKDEGFTVDRLIELKSEGIASSVSAGWL